MKRSFSPCRPWVRLASVLAGVAAVFLAGCESTSSTPPRPVYSASQAGQVMTQEAGLVLAVEEVVIQAPSSASNTGTGAQLGSAVGRGAVTGSPTAIVGAVGGLIGSKAGASLDNQVGDKITVQLDTGKTVTIIQARGADAPLMPGERVVIETGGSPSTYGSGTARVVREPAKPDPQYIGALPAQPATPKRVW